MYCDHVWANLKHGEIFCMCERAKCIYILIPTEKRGAISLQLLVGDTFYLFWGNKVKSQYIENPLQARYQT